MKTTAVVLGGILLFGSPLANQQLPQAPAQEKAATEGSPAAPAASRLLTLRAALDLGSRQNLNLAAARLRRAIAQAGIRIAGQLPNPSASLTAARDAPHEGLLFEQTLEIGGKRARRIELAREEASLTNVEISALERTVRQRVREAYYEAAASHAATAQRARALELARRLQEIARARFEAGDVPQLDVIQAELEVSRAETELEVARQRERVTQAQLNALLNEPFDALWELAGQLEDVLPPLALADLTERAARSSPEIERLAAEQKIEERRRSLLQAERIPNLSVQFGSDFNSPGDFRAGPRGGLALTLPLFTRNQGELSQSAATLLVLRGEAAAARRSVTGRVEVAYYEWRTRQAQVELYRRVLVPSAQRLEALAEESYREGKAGLLTVLDARRNVQQVEREYIESLLAMHEAFAELEETVGTPLD